MKAWMLVPVVAFYLVTPAWAFDDLSDPSFEKRLHRIYLSSYSDIVSDVTWSTFMEKVDSETYQVRRGDTLWGLSQVFFGDGHYWSKVWSLNSDITNPHQIYPSTVIQFSVGSVAKAPVVAVDNQQAEVTEVAETPESTAQVTIQWEIQGGLYPGAPAIPPPKSYVKPLPRHIPTSLAAPTEEYNQYDEAGMSFDVRPPPPVAPRLVPHIFIHQGNRPSLPHIGEVVEMEEGYETAGFGDSIYVKTESPLAVGNRVTVVGQDYEFSGGRYRGTVFRYMGEIEITDIINENSYKAEVVLALMPFEVGAYLTTETIPAFSVAGGNPRSEVFEVAGGAYENDRKVFGPGSILFLGGGKSQGIRVGDTFGVYKNRQARYPNANFWQSPQSIGLIKVFRVENDMCSAMVLAATEEIVPGDTTGAIGAKLTNIGEGERPEEELDDISYMESEEDASYLKSSSEEDEADDDDVESEDSAEDSGNDEESDSEFDEIDDLGDADEVSENEDSDSDELDIDNEEFIVETDEDEEFDLDDAELTDEE